MKCKQTFPMADFLTTELAYYPFDLLFYLLFQYKLYFPIMILQIYL